ncbi:hypothetical protein D6T64_10285 [Cryobacterium melibiosiphilum]|uniref:Uncharacterized protein n=1 Tax=Cryobacterium melibiosiphilum TaxID=995039 RepID=A0A3A5MKV3_9MICO|nr:hypothetical protein D6T64_10285 [Cryobacterium melibiosiphilum]
MGLLTRVAVVGLLTIAGGVLVKTASAEPAVRSAGAAVYLGQVVAQSVQQGVRGAQAISSVPVLPGGARLLVVWSDRVPGDQPGYGCQAWYYSPAGGGTIYTTHTALTKIVAPTTPLLLAPWDTLAEGVTPIGGAAVFAKATATSVTMSFAITAQEPALISSAATSAITATGTVPCFD